ncbi:MAG TPA: helix-turn-helix domain-containing protein [Acidimicrobiales bacterium]|nr:helix-turn-helix domain-containing protein [Acidimicrobiales bacterium]
MKRRDRKSHCPVNVALETFGDPWTLLVVRDIVFHGKHTFGEFFASAERVTTSVLADRLASLVAAGILTKHPSATDGRKECYRLTDKGLGLIPVLVEMANWSIGHDPLVPANPHWLAKVQSDRDGLYQLIRNTVMAGGSVFCGEHNVIEQLSQGG